MSSPFDITGKRFVITGASSGIGKQCALTIAQLGGVPILLGRNQERLEEAAQQISAEALYFSLDITDFQAVEDWVKTHKESIGNIDGLINAAGISPTLPLRALSTEKMQEAFEVNVIAAINLTKLLCKPAFMKNGGSIVFISSVMGTVGEMGKGLYGMTKGALIAGVKSLALEYASKNIRFNTISPAVVVTPMSMSSVYSKDPEALERVKSYHPLGLGEPEDVANTAIFLLSAASKWITGTNIILDGGYTAK